MLAPGQTLGRYRVEAQLGAGGMGEVYRAWDSMLRRWVALKVVAKGDGSGLAERLLGEARAAAALRHPNIVSVFDVGEARASGAGDEGDYAFVSMDLVEGRPLRDYVGDKSVAPETQLAWLLQIATALRAAHKAGLVHRDVKPDNVMIAVEGEARVLDFGLAKTFTVDVQAPTAHEDAHGPPSFRTGEGRVIGTPAYMAPEQLAGGPPSPAWDQYSWGVLGCELLTGQHPRVAGLISVSGWVKAESLSHVPSAIAQVVARAMAPSPDQRFPSMDAVVVALGGPSSGAGPLVIAASNPPPKSISTSPSAVVNVAQIGDTLATPVHPNAPEPQRARRVLPWVLAAASVVLAGSVLVWWRVHRRDTASAIPAPMAPSSSTTVTVTPVVTAVAPSSSAQPSAVATALPSTTTTWRAPPPPPPPPPAARKVVVSLRATPTLQYDGAAIDRVVGAARFASQMCVERHPLRTVPASIAVDIELWNIGNDFGKVRDVRIAEPPALASCLREAFIGLSFGPPKSAAMPPGAVFVILNVDPS